KAAGMTPRDFISCSIQAGATPPLAASSTNTRVPDSFRRRVCAPAARIRPGYGQDRRRQPRTVGERQLAGEGDSARADQDRLRRKGKENVFDAWAARDANLGGGVDGVKSFTGHRSDDEANYYASGSRPARDERKNARALGC